jgi:hypothetical protein
LDELLPKKSIAPAIVFEKTCSAIVLYGKFFIEEEVRAGLAANGIDPVLFM